MLNCPKCQSAMEQIQYGREVEVDRCVNCKGLWFDLGEVEALRGAWMSECVDNGDPVVGLLLNVFEDVDCPRCGVQMVLKYDSENPGICFEVCSDHGMYFDAGEFASTQRDELMKHFQAFMKNNES